MKSEDANSIETVTEVKRSYRWLRSFVGVIVGLLCLGLLVCGMAYRTLQHPVRLSQPEFVSIRRDTSLAFAAQRLQERHLIPNALAFRIYAHVTNRADQLKIGEYKVTDGMTPIDILKLLVSGRAIAFNLVVPEGKWASEITQLVKQRWPQASPQFNALIKSPQQWNAKGLPFRIEGDTLEGYLFPDTYQFEAKANAEQMIALMLKRFESTVWKAYHDHPPTDGRSLYQVLILASLVEAEAKVDSERARIAGVYMNRLHASPPNPSRMDCDATLIYAQGKRVGRVLNRDKLIDSPYNTYRFAGLPPGPINNPGLKSFIAALHPEKHQYYYYVARGTDGTHLFARTLTEQSANIRRAQGK